VAVAIKAVPSRIACLASSPTPVETPVMTHTLGPMATAQSILQTWAPARIGQSNPQGRIVRPHRMATLVGFLRSDRAAGLTDVDVRIDAGANLAVGQTGGHGVVGRAV